MMPTLFTIPFINRDVPSFGLMMMMGFLGAIWWAVRRAQKSGADPDVILNCGFIALIAVIAVRTQLDGTREFVFNPAADTRLDIGDEMIVVGHPDQVARLRKFAQA